MNTFYVSIGKSIKNIRIRTSKEKMLKWKVGDSESNLDDFLPIFGSPWTQLRASNFMLQTSRMNSKVSYTWPFIAMKKKYL